MSQQEKVRGFVLRQIPYGESDWIVTLLTEKGHKLTGYASKARGSSKRFGHALDLFNFVEVLFNPAKEGSQLVRLREADLIEGMEGLRQDLQKFAIACYFGEMALEFLHEKENTAAVFEAFSRLVNHINKEKKVASGLLPMMEHKFLEIFGYAPNFSQCNQCGHDLVASQEYFFHGAKGGVLCAACEQRDQSEHPYAHDGKEALLRSSQAYPLSYQAIQQLLDYQKRGEYSFDAPCQWDRKNALQVRRALEHFIQYTAGKPFKSLRFLSQVFPA